MPRQRVLAALLALPILGAVQQLDVEDDHNEYDSSRERSLLYEVV